MKIAHEVKPELVNVNFDDLSLVYNVTMLSKSEKVSIQPIILEEEIKIILDELKRGHNSILEYSNIEFYVKNAPNIDLLYLSSYKNLSIMKPSFKRFDHNSFCLTREIQDMSISSLLKEYIEGLYRFVYTKKNNSWDTNLENILPMSSTVDFIAKTNIREFSEIYSNREKVPSSLKMIIENIFDKSNYPIKEILNNIKFTLSDGYYKDRLLSDASFEERDSFGLIYDNYCLNLPKKDTKFIIRKPISFKLLSQIIRERGLNIELDLSSIENLCYNTFEDELKDLEPSNLRSIYKNIKGSYGIQNALGILPFATTVDAKITIPLEKLEHGFFNKLKANEPLKSFAEYVKNCIYQKYPTLINS